MTETVIIVGGGIAGLTTAYLLKKKGIDALVLEASNRLGGRIYTKTVGNNVFELGATWVFQDDVLKKLIHELELKLYPQYLKGDALIKYSPTMSIQKESTDKLMNGAVYHKIEGGTGSIINALTQQLDNSKSLVNNKVVSLSFDDENVTVALENGTKLQSEKVVLALPPKSIAEGIKFTPSFDQDNVMANTHTWMGESIKFTVVLDKDYWRKNNLSGFIYSNYGLIREAQDHTSSDGKTFGLVGFLQLDPSLTDDYKKRKQLVVNELIELLGINEENIIGYNDLIWGEHYKDQQNNNFNEGLIPHQLNGHSIYQQSHYNDRLYFIGAETSPTNPGYMEGAVKSAFRVSRQISL